MSNPDTTRIFNYPEVTTPASDAKILLDSQTVGSKCIDANLFRCDLIDKTITQRGTFEASEDDADGFKKVVVDIPYTDVHVASGPIATFEGEDLPLKSLTASIVPVQSGSGDPSPTNVRPISGWTEEVVSVCGKNLITEVIEGYDLVSSTGEQRVAPNWYITNYVNVQYGYTYTFSGTSSATVCYYDRYKNFTRNTLSQRTITPQEGECYVRVNSLISGYAEPQIEEGNEATSFSPFGQTTTIPFTDSQGNPVEVYGGSVDVVSGVLTVDRVIKTFDGSEDWQPNGDSGVFLRTAKIPNIDTSKSFITDTYKVVNEGLAPSNGCINYNNGRNAIQIRDERAMEVEAFKTMLQTNPVQFVYELATPTTFFTQPTSIKSLDGENNVFASTGDVDVEYQTVWVRPTE